MMKKLMILFVATMAAMGAWAATEMVNGVEWTYQVSGGSATITDVPTSISNQVEIPQSLNGYQVTGIRSWAFSGCNRIKSINIPSSVTSIGDGAFSGCSSLTDIVIPLSVRTIGSYAFDDCYDLESISIPSSVRTIGEYAFDDCFRLKFITVASGNAAYEFTGGLLISKDKTQLVAVSREVSTVKIPEGVREIPDGFFAGCNKLTSVSIPSSIDEYGIGSEGSVFSCWYERYDEMINEWYEETIGCPNLKTVTVASGNPYYKSIGGMLCSVYDDEMSLETVPQALTDVIIPEEVTDVYSKAFEGCAKLKAIKVASGNRYYKSVNGLLLTKDGKELVWVPNALTSVTIPDGVVDLGWAFDGCEKLTSVKIPDSVVAVGRSTFSECSESFFDKKTIPGCITVDGWIVGVTDEAYERYGENGEEWNLDLTKARGIAESAFYRGQFSSCDSTGIISGLHSIVIPKNIIAVGDRAFYRCENLSSVTIESGVRYIAATAFDECHESLYDDTTLPGFRLVDGWLIDREYYYDDSIKSLDLTGLRGVAGKVNVCCGWNGSLFAEGMTNLVVGDGMTAISHGAFTYSYELEEVEIADSVAFIGENAFLDCRNLKRVKMPDSLRGKVPASAFSQCSPGLQIEYYKSIFTVEFDANYPPFSNHDGVENVIESRSVESGETIGALPTSVLSKYKFLGWYTAPEGGTKISATTKVTGNVTYYAQWVYDGSAIVSVVVAEGCEAMGKVTGGKTAKAGTKLMLKATPKKGYVFAGWYSDADCTVPVEGAWQVAEYTYKVKDLDTTFYAKFLKATDPIAKEITVDAGEFHVVTPGVIADIPIFVESACLYTVKASGLPKGLALKRNSDKSYRITGKSTTPGEKTVTLKVTNLANSKGVSYKFKILVDNWRNDDVFFSEDEWGDKSIIENHYDNMIAGVPVTDFFIPAATNCTVSIPKELGLKFNGKTCQVTGTPKAPGKYLVTFTKKFKTGYDKKKKKDIYTTYKATTLFVVYQGHGEQCDGVIEPGIILNVTLKNLAEGNDYGNIETASTNDIYIGVKQEIAILAEGLEGVANTLKVSGLPKGLEFKKGKITGVPAKAGVYKVKVSASNKWKWTGLTSFALNVLSLPEWARGQFMGEVYSGDDEFFSESFSMSVGSTGKISGKFKLGGTNWTFSASSFVSSMDSYDPEFVCKVNAKATVKVGKKKKTVTSPLEFTLVQDPEVSEIASEAEGVFGPDLSFYACRIPGVKVKKTAGGTVELSKSYGQVGEGKSVKLTAEPKKGYAFAGWYDEDDNLVSQALNYSLKMEDADRFFFARFVTTAEDKSSLVVSDIEEMWTETDGSFRLALGGYVTSLSLPKITVSGLPPGLKFTSKRLEIWESICQFEPLVIDSNSIYGNATKPGAYTVKVSVSNASVSEKKAIVRKFKIHVPNLTAANDYFREGLDNWNDDKYILSVGISNLDDFLPSLALNSESGMAKLAVSGLPSGLKYDAKMGKITGVATKAGTYTVTLTVTEGKTKYVSTITIEVEPLPEILVGTYTGLIGRDVNVEKEDPWMAYGMANVTVAANGKIAAKMTLPCGTYSFSAASWDYVEDGVYFAVMRTKKGNEFELVIDSKRDWKAIAEDSALRVNGYKEFRVPIWRNEHAKGGNVESDPIAYELISEIKALKKVAFKIEGSKSSGYEVTEVASNDRSANLTVTFDTKGGVKYAGNFDGVRVSGSTFLCIDDNSYYTICDIVVPVGKTESVYIPLGIERDSDGELRFNVEWVRVDFYEQNKEKERVQLWENGPYWATTNIGAEKPEDYGYYFWWGDTVGYLRKNDKWVASDGSNSNFSFDYYDTLTNVEYLTLQSKGWITSNNILAPEHDAAHVQWGGNWRMPTYQELYDLCNKCDWEWISMNGVNGYIVKGRGSFASYSIFLPCAGRIYSDSKYNASAGAELYDVGAEGYYWSSVPVNDFESSWNLAFQSNNYELNYYYYRSTGRSIRPVQGFTK